MPITIEGIPHYDLDNDEDPFGIGRGCEYYTDRYGNVHAGWISEHLTSGDLIVNPINGTGDIDWSHQLQVKRSGITQTWAW